MYQVTHEGDSCQYEQFLFVNPGVTHFKAPHEAGRSPDNFVYAPYTDLETGEEVQQYLPPPKRSHISDFSPDSRRRLYDYIHSFERGPDLFLTLTYSTLFHADPEEWKRHLDNFSRSLKRVFPGWFEVWKLEPQNRGAPHYHLLIWTDRSYTDDEVRMLRRSMAKLWSRILYRDVMTENKRKHLAAGIQLKKLDSKPKTRAYVSKYTGKPIQGHKLPGWSRPGRYWGKLNQVAAPAQMKTAVRLTRNQYDQTKRILRKWFKSKKTAKWNTDRITFLLKKCDSLRVMVDQEVMMRIVEWLCPGQVHMTSYYSSYLKQYDEIPTRWFRNEFRHAQI